MYTATQSPDPLLFDASTIHIIRNNYEHIIIYMHRKCALVTEEAGHLFISQHITFSPVDLYITVLTIKRIGQERLHCDLLNRAVDNREVRAIVLLFTSLRGCSPIGGFNYKQVAESSVRHIMKTCVANYRAKMVLCKTI